MAALTLATEVYRDKILGAWIGKSAGVTLGKGPRGQLTPAFLNYYSPVPGQPAPSAALDFQVAWLSAAEQAGADIDGEILRQVWLDRLDYTEDEYGYAVLNFGRGLPAPACGAHSNWFRHSTGALMRADFWAMMAPGNPQAAAALAYHDAVLDHSEEGVWAAMFLAGVCSAGFFLHETLPLMTIGLAMIPRTCRSARAVKTALAAGQRGATWLEARENVQHEVGDRNFTDVAQNLGFFTIGLLYGQLDFGGSVCAGVNCGYDSEAVGGALGAVMGIIKGSSGLPADWTRPIGDVLIPGHGARDVQGVLSLSALANRTVTAGRAIALVQCPDIEISDAPPAPLSDAATLPVPPPADAGGTDERDETETIGELPFVEFNAPPPLDAAAEPAAAVDPGEAPASSSAGGGSARTEGSGMPASVAPQAPAYEPPGSLPAGTPAVFAPQPISEESPQLVMAESPAPAPSASAGPLAPDPMGAIAWADSALVKPLLVTPTNTFVGSAGPFEVHLDTGESPSIAYGQMKTLAVEVFNRGAEAFSGRMSLLAPPGWQAAAPANFGQRQYAAAHSGVLRAEFRLLVPEGQARIEIANSIMVRLTPDAGAAPAEVQFVLMGAACWWTVGSFANFDGEGFDRSYLPEDRPGLSEQYVARSLQTIRWEKRTFPESVLDLEPLFRGSSGVCYGQTVLRNPFAREAKLTASSNNGVKVWLNGSLVLRRHQRTAFRPTLNEEHWTADIQLREGDNLVMVKWVRGTEPYQFSLTVSDRQGRALPDVGNTFW